MEKITLILASYNENNSALRFLESYRKQTKKADEVIIVDGGSNDGTIELINDYSNKYQYLNIILFVKRKFNKKHLLSPVAAARNFAIKKTENTIICSADFGCTLDPSWLFNLTINIKSNSDFFLGGLNKINKINPFSERLVEFFEFKDDVANFLPSSRNICFTKRQWMSVRGYPEYTLTAEDTLFAIRLRNKYECRFVPKSIVHWDGPKNIKEFSIKQFNYSRGDGFLLIKKTHHFKSFIRILLPFLLFNRNLNYKNFNIRLCFHLSSVFGYMRGILDRVVS
jgi:succinoglycan biosynthesis protein ExoA